MAAKEGFSDMLEIAKSREPIALSLGKQAISEHAKKPLHLLNTGVIDKIKSNLNINIYEAKIWVALLSRGIATASQLADISGVPRSRCYDVLETLEKEGFIITKLGKPIKYIAVKPDEVIKRQKKLINKEFERKIDFIDNIKGTDAFKELELLHKTGIDKVSIEELGNAVKGKNELKRQIKDMLNKAKKSIMIVTTKEGFQGNIRLLENMKKTGVKIEVGVPTGMPKIRANNGIKIRQVDINARFVSVDGQRALFMINNDSIDPNKDTGILVKSEFFTKAIDNIIRANMR